ncbi:hypothetical protein GF406_21240 [candidate division KSB1 bacterium]|nr:hypothetical protein [candidate division KSB1 bacterium]
MQRQKKKFVHEGKYGAELNVELIDDATGWAPFLSPDDAYKLDNVREALRKGDLNSAEQYGRIYELCPVSAN